MGEKRTYTQGEKNTLSVGEKRTFESEGEKRAFDIQTLQKKEVIHLSSKFYILLLFFLIEFLLLHPESELNELLYTLFL